MKARSLTHILMPLLAVMLSVCGCGRKEPRPIAPPASAELVAARRVCAAANIVICCVDAARRDHLGCYGYRRATTPEIDKLAAAGVRFQRPVTEMPYTLAAVASLFTGEYPDTHGAGVPGVGMRIPLRLTTLPEACRAAGMRTAVFSSSGQIIKPHGFGDGVDHFVRVYTGNPEQGRVAELQRAWRAWLDTVGRKRFFMYVHIMPPHHPYEQAGQFRDAFDPGYHGSLGPTGRILFELDAGKLRVSERDLRHIIAMYDEALRYADWAVGTLARDLRERGALDNTIFIAFADHGEAFGEHGRFLHSSTVYNELTHIPLVVRLPSAVRGFKQTIGGFAQLSDIPPTLASLAGLRFPAGQVQGYNLAPEVFGGAHALRRAAFSRCLPQPRLLRAVELADAKGIFDERGRLIELYDLTTDPAEERNLVRKRGGLAERVTAVYQAWAARQKHLEAHGAPPAREKLDKETRDWLRSLGYVQ